VVLCGKADAHQQRTQLTISLLLAKTLILEVPSPETSVLEAELPLLLIYNKRSRYSLPSPDNCTFPITNIEADTDIFGVSWAINIANLLIVMLTPIGAPLP
jgi:hypothetical protein